MWIAPSEDAVKTEQEQKDTEVVQGWTTVVRRNRKCLCTSASVVVAISKSLAGWNSQKGDIPKAVMIHEGRITVARLGFSRGIYAYAMYSGILPGISIRK